MFFWYKAINLYLQYIFLIYFEYAYIKQLSKGLNSVKPY